MATLGVGEIVATVFKNLDFVGGTRGFKDIPKLGSPLLIFIVMLVIAAFIIRFYKTNIGYAVRATRDDEISARSLGINIYKTKIISFYLVLLLQVWLAYFTHILCNLLVPKKLVFTTV